MLLAIFVFLTFLRINVLLSKFVIDLQLNKTKSCEKTQPLEHRG